MIDKIRYWLICTSMLVLWLMLSPGVIHGIFVAPNLMITIPAITLSISFVWPIWPGYAVLATLLLHTVNLFMSVFFRDIWTKDQAMAVVVSIGVIGLNSLLVWGINQYRIHHSQPQIDKTTMGIAMNIARPAQCSQPQIDKITMGIAMNIARPAQIYSILKVIVCVAFLGAVVLLGTQYPILYSGLLFLPAAVLTVIRHLHGMTMRPYLQLHDRGISIRIWNIRFLIPWVFAIEREIAWSDLLRCTVHTTVGIFYSELILQCKSGWLTIKPHVFVENAQTLQQAILDAYARNNMGKDIALGDRAEIVGKDIALGDRAEIVAFNQQRFITPYTIRGTRTLWPTVASLAIAVGLGIVSFALDIPEIIYSVTIPLIFAITSTVMWAVQQRARVIQLRAEGLAIGRSLNPPLVAAWEHIVFVQKRVMKDSSFGRSITTGLHIGLRNGQTIDISGKYEISFDELELLLNRPLSTTSELKT